MKNTRMKLRALWRDERGVTSIEYALIGSLIAMVIVGSVAVLGEGVQALYDRVAACFVDINSVGCVGNG